MNTTHQNEIFSLLSFQLNQIGASKRTRNQRRSQLLMWLEGDGGGGGGMRKGTAFEGENRETTTTTSELKAHQRMATRQPTRGKSGDDGDSI